MYSTTNPKGQGMQVPTDRTTAGGEDRENARKRHRIEAIFWTIGMIIFIASCIIIHFHPQPYPIDLAATRTIQGLHLVPWLLTALQLPSVLNNPIPSTVAIIAWFVGMIAVGLVRKLRKLPSLLWFISGIFLVLTVMTSAGLNVLFDDIVGRPRPDPKVYHIHLYTPLVPFPTYPSGHTEHDVAYYGFLLYLSFTKPVRDWRYRWLLLPFQLYAVYDIFAIGYSRVLEGDHWLTDVLGGYLEGALYLFFFIFLYRLIVDWFSRYREKKMAGKAVQAS
ncbi:MAG: phosphatase PAP2 family protein [Chloroflexi bacterium]|nr:MAG: phosphatase PAP2 family protein [Chloroflexota bacterium]